MAINSFERGLSAVIEIPIRDDEKVNQSVILVIKVHSIILSDPALENDLRST